MVPLYNTENIPGQKYELIGLVKGSMIQSKHLGRDIGNALKSIVGGELRGYSEMLNEARAIATKRMIEEATATEMLESAMLKTGLKKIKLEPPRNHSG